MAISEALKALLGEDLAAQVEEKIGDKPVDVTDEGRWVPKSKFDEKNTALVAAQKLASDNETALATLRDQTKDKPDLKEAFDKLKASYDQLKIDSDKTIAATRKEFAIKDALRSYKPKDIADVLPFIDPEKVSLTDDGIVGLKEQVEPLVEKKDYLFEGKDSYAGKHSSGGASSSGVNPWKKESFNLTEQGKIYREDPEKAARLKAEAGA